MKKKTLVSVLAMTSASMAAYANANLDQIKTEVDQWVGAEKPSLVNGVLTSPMVPRFLSLWVPFYLVHTSCRLLP